MTETTLQPWKPADEYDEEFFESVLSKTPEELQEWIQDQNLEPRMQELWLFHYWMKHNTDLSSGTTVDYRKEIFAHWNEIEDGEEPNREEMRSQRKSAVNKYQEFLASDFLENHSKTGEGGTAD